jgi:hypothetical protein
MSLSVSQKVKMLRGEMGLKATLQGLGAPASIIRTVESYDYAAAAKYLAVTGQQALLAEAGDTAYLPAALNGFV